MPPPNQNPGLGGNDSADAISAAADRIAGAADAMERAASRIAAAGAVTGGTHTTANPRIAAAGAVTGGPVGGSAAGLRGQVELERKRLDYMRSPAGRAALREELNLRKQLSQAEDLTAWQKRKIELGSWAALMEAGNKKITRMGSGLQQIGRLGETVFTGMSAGVLGLASLGDPFVTWPTFTESIKGMGIALGTIVLPVVDSLSGALQRTTKWINGLSEDTKLWTTRSIIWVAAGAATVGTIYKIIIAANALRIALGGVRAAMLASGIGLAVAVVGALAAEYAILGDKASDAAQNIGSAADQAARMAGIRMKSQYALQAQDLEKIQDKKVRAAAMAAAGDPAKLQKVLEQWKAQVDKDLTAGRARQIGPLAEASRRDARVNKSLEPIWGRTEQLRQKRLEEEKAAALSDTVLGRLGRLFGGDTGAFTPGTRVKQTYQEWMGPQGRGPGGRAAAEADTLYMEARKKIEAAGLKIIQDIPQGPGGRPRFWDKNAAAPVDMAESERRKKAGEISARDLYLRIYQGIAGRLNPRELEKGWANAGARFKLGNLEEQQKLSQKLLEAVGGGGMKREIRLPGQPAIGSMQSFVDAMQMQALQGGDISRENQTAQLLNALQALGGNVKTVEDAIRAQQNWWQPNRGRIRPQNP